MIAEAKLGASLILSTSLLAPFNSHAETGEGGS